jgi:hypothetical protein
MSIIYNLSTNIAISILSEWIDIKSIVNLDSAVCHSIERISFLFRLSSIGFIFSGLDNMEYNLDFMIWLKWVIMKKIKIKTLTLKFHDDGKFLNTVELINSQILTRVTSLNCLGIKSSQISPNDMKRIFSSCTRMNSLNVEFSEIFNSVFLNSISSTLLDQIVKFSYIGNHLGLITASRNLKHLQNIHITGSPYYNINIHPPLKKLIGCNINLIEIKLGHNLKTDITHLSCIHQNCKQIQSIILQNHTLIQHSGALISLILDCSTLHFLNINNNFWYESYFSEITGISTDKIVIAQISLIFDQPIIYFNAFCKSIAIKVTDLVLFFPDETLLRIISEIMWTNLILLQFGDKLLITNLVTKINQIVKLLNQQSPKMKHFISCLDGETLTEVFQYILQFPFLTIKTINGFGHVLLLMQSERALKLQKLTLVKSAVDIVFTDIEEEDFRNTVTDTNRKLIVEFI